MSTIFYTIGISLFDSLSTTYQIILFVLLLTTDKPLRNAFSFLAGISGIYFLCGLGIYLTLDQLRDLLTKFLSAAAAVSNPVYYQFEFLLGTASIAWGIWYFYRNKNRGPTRHENWMVSKLRHMNSWIAFGLGALISFTSISPQYVAALTKYAALQLVFPAAAGLIVFYNLVYASPMILILGLYLAARRGNEDDHDALHEKARLLNLHLTTWTLAGFGLFCVIDAGSYFVLGHALIQERFF